MVLSPATAAAYAKIEIRPLVKVPVPRLSKASERACSVAMRSKPASKPTRPCPITSDIEYTAAELQFMAAMEEFKKATGVKFPTAAQTLSVLVDRLYYRQTAVARIGIA